VTSRKARRCELGLIAGVVWLLAVLGFIVLIDDVPMPMDPTTLYYALNTIAQRAAALAALIGFLDLWRLDRLHDEWEQATQAFRGVAVRRGLTDAPWLPVDEIVQVVEQQPRDDRERQLCRRWRAIPGERRRLMRALVGFLAGTLGILVLAIAGLMFVDELRTCRLTPWLLLGAGVGPGIGPAYVVWQAGRSIS
jgi:hypothetical protein